MKEYIEREAALKWQVPHYSTNGVEIIESKAIPVEYIENLPAADVVEVRPGRWTNPMSVECYQCSVCGEYRNQEYGLNAPIFDKFCPHCGAKMDGGVDE